MHQLIEYLLAYGVILVFLNVLLEQLGLPIPALPTIVVAGALCARNQFETTDVVLAALSACLIADTIWYFMGRRYGRGVLGTLCKVSLSPASCVRQTESFFDRWGARSLLFAKFIPGFSTIAPPLSGATKLPLATFLFFDTFGSLAWIAAGFIPGLIFHRAIDRAMETLENLGSGALALVGAALILFIIVKWIQRRNFYTFLRTSRISGDELQELIEKGAHPLIFDVRSPVARRTDPRKIPGAIIIDEVGMDAALAGLDPDREIVLYCT